MRFLLRVAPTWFAATDTFQLSRMATPGLMARTLRANDNVVNSGSNVDGGPRLRRHNNTAVPHNDDARENGIPSFCIYEFITTQIMDIHMYCGAAKHQKAVPIEDG